MYPNIPKSDYKALNGDDVLLMFPESLTIQKRDRGRNEQAWMPRKTCISQSNFRYFGLLFVPDLK